MSGFFGEANERIRALTLPFRPLLFHRIEGTKRNGGVTRRGILCQQQQRAGSKPTPPSLQYRTQPYPSPATLPLGAPSDGKLGNWRTHFLTPLAVLAAGSCVLTSELLHRRGGAESRARSPLKVPRTPLFLTPLLV